MDRLTEYQWVVFFCSFIANIFIRFQEKPLFDKFPEPSCYIYYVDDTFASFTSHWKVNSFFQHLNNLHLSSKFMMEGEEKTCCLFWMFYLRKLPYLLSLAYTENSLLQFYLSCDSFAPKSSKIKLSKLLPTVQLYPWNVSWIINSRRLPTIYLQMVTLKVLIWVILNSLFLNFLIVKHLALQIVLFATKYHELDLVVSYLLIRFLPLHP